MKRLLLFCILVLVCCRENETASPRAAFTAVDAAWPLYSNAKPDSFCQLPRFDAWNVPALTTYQKACPIKSVACLQWRFGWQNNDGTWNLTEPVGVLSPALAEEDRMAGEIHELIHAFIFATNSSADLFDYQHRNPRFWASKNSVFATALASASADAGTVMLWRALEPCTNLDTAHLRIQQLHDNK